MYGDLNLDMHNAPCRKCRFCCEKAAPKESCYSTIHIFHGTIVLFVLSLITLACNLWILKENNEVKIAIAVELYKSSTRTSDNTPVSTTNLFVIFNSMIGVYWFVKFYVVKGDAWFYSEKKKHFRMVKFLLFKAKIKICCLNSN